MFEQFQFIRPVFLLLIPALVILTFVWMRASLKSSQWRQILPMHLHQHLVSASGDTQSKQPFLWLSFALVIACIAAAGPTWEKLPQPVYQTDSGRVLVMDMSLSMRATDVTPNRLMRANFKAIDLIKEINDGEVGLVAYAGDAFTISPLTEDISNLENLIPSLSPEIMPSSGSNPVAGLNQAIQLLDNAGYQHGHIYWITDGIQSRDISPLRSLISQSKYEFSVLTIGTKEGAPVQLTDGTLLKQNNGSIVIPQLNASYLREALNVSNARQTSMSIDDSDIKSMLLTSQRIDQVRQDSTQESTGDAWRDMGAYVVIALLPIVALLFRKGVVFSLMLTFIFMAPNTNQAIAQTAQVNNNETSSPSSFSAGNFEGVQNSISSMFLNDNQKGERAFNKGDYQQAQQIFDNINWRAAAAYKAGDYESALKLYQQGDGLNSIYNQGNALAQLGELQKAIDAYDKVLKIDPDHEQALANKALLESLLEQQEQQEQQNQQEQEQQNEQDQQQDSEQEQSDSNDGQQGQDSEQQQDPSDSSQSEEQSESESNADEQEAGEQEPSEPEQNQQQGEQNQQQDANESASAQEQEETQNDGEEEAVQAVRQDELTPEEREQMQRLQTLMNKVPDNPAFLLQRKMLIEAQKRKQFSPPTNQEQEW
jgi:Ca-activated chloride channel family protein